MINEESTTTEPLIARPRWRQPISTVSAEESPALANRVVYHGTDLKAANAIRRQGVLRGDWPLFGPGICLTLERAVNFVCIKAGARTRRTGRVLELTIEPSLLANAEPETVCDALTLVDDVAYRPLRELRLDDPRIKSWRVLTMKDVDARRAAELIG